MKFTSTHTSVKRSNSPRLYVRLKAMLLSSFYTLDWFVLGLNTVAYLTLEYLLGYSEHFKAKVMVGLAKPLAMNVFLRRTLYWHFWRLQCLTCRLSNGYQSSILNGVGVISQEPTAYSTFHKSIAGKSAHRNFRLLIFCQLITSPKQYPFSTNKGAGICSLFSHTCQQ